MEAVIKEANITIEGVQLSVGQSMALRVAIGSFLIWLTPEHKRELGPIGEAYELRLKEVAELINRGCR